MRSAILIEDGMLQLVLTPENDFERNVVRAWENKQLTAHATYGTFGRSRDGFVRQRQDDYSLMVRVQPATITAPIDYSRFTATGEAP